MIRTTIAAGLIALSTLAAAQTAAPAATASPSSPAKKELVAKVLKLQQPGIENFARTIVQQNTVQVLQAARTAVQQRVATDRREAVWRDIEADARKFAEESFPIVRDRAVKLMPTVFGPALEEKFSEDELRQVLAILESPAAKKFNTVNAEVMRSFGEKLMADVRSNVEPKMQAYQQSVSARLAPAASGASGK
jgi:uncharacterized protein